MSKKKKLLLVEDEAIIALSEKRELEARHYTVHQALNGEKAVEMALKTSPGFDLILMDIDLGKGIDGTQAAARILKEKDIPILFLSSHTEPEIVEKTEKISSYGFVVKQSGMTVLDASIKMAFKLHDTKIAELNKEENLHKTEGKYRLLFTNSISATAVHEMLFDENGKPVDYLFVNVNKAFEEYTGLKKDEILGKKVTRVIPGIEQSEFISSYGKVVQTGQTLKFKSYAKQLGRFYNVQAYRIDESHFATDFTDITELVLIERQQKKREKDLRESQKIAHLGTCHIDIATDKVEWTEELYKMYDMDPSIPPPPYSEHKKLFTPDSWEKLASSLEKTETRGLPCDLELETRRKDGSCRWMWVHGEPERNLEGKITGIWGAIQDITPRKKQEMLLEKQLKEKEIILKETNHRIKNNIAMLISLLSFHMDSDSAEVRDILTDCINQIHGIQILYETLLSTNQYESVSIRPYLENLITTILSILPGSRPLTIDTELEDFALPSSKVFPLGLITNEILTNAVKYAFPDQTSGTIHISLKRDQTTARLIIEDNGQGFSEQLPRKQPKGFGIQLVEMLAEQLEGKFEISGKKGTRAVLEFKP